MGTQQAAHYRVSVKALVRDEQDRILLVRQANGKWEMLGGGLEHGEEPHIGLAREVFEEAGLELETISDSPVHFITMHNSDHDLYFANVLYEATLRNLDFTPSDECEELRFVTREEAAQLNLQVNIRKLLPLL